MKAFGLRGSGKLLKGTLYIVAGHSFFVGLMLIVQPRVLMTLSGFVNGYERFFPTQAGVFHIVMAVCYYNAGMDPEKNRPLISFSITAKAIATVFLLSYYLIADAKPVILVSAIGDGLMGLLIYMLARNHFDSPD